MCTLKNLRKVEKMLTYFDFYDNMYSLCILMIANINETTGHIEGYFSGKVTAKMEL